MKKIMLLFGTILLSGCSYSLKTSLITDPVDSSDTVQEISFEDCHGNEYCQWKALEGVHSFAGLESYKKTISTDANDAVWDAYLQTRINYNAVNENDCEALSDTDIKTRCLYATRFNNGEKIDCFAEDSEDLCYEQQMYSNPSIGQCNIKEKEDRLACILTMALMTNKHAYCNGLSKSEQKDCRSMAANSLYFCDTKACVDRYFTRNMTSSSRLAYCRFDDTGLQEYCEKQIKSWFALSHDNFLYCSTRECYARLIEKKIYDRPEEDLMSIGGSSCEHLTNVRSNERCRGFVADVFAKAKSDIGACASFTCFESFKGNLLVKEETQCAIFEKQLFETDDVFGQSQELSMCLSVVDYNKALLFEDDSLCHTPDCVEEVMTKQEIEEKLSPEQQEVLLTGTIDPEASPEDIKEQLGQVDAKEALKDIDLNKAVEGIDVNALREAIDPEGKMGDVDLNEEVKKIDFNEEIKKIDVKALLEQIDLETVLESKE